MLAVRWFLAATIVQLLVYVGSGSPDWYPIQLLPFHNHELPIVQYGEVTLLIKLDFPMSVLFPTFKHIATCSGSTDKTELIQSSRVASIEIDCAHCVSVLNGTCFSYAKWCVPTPVMFVESIMSGILSLKAQGCPHSPFPRFFIIDKFERIGISATSTSGASEFPAMGSMYDMGGQHPLFIQRASMCGVGISHSQHMDGTVISTSLYAVLNASTPCLHVPLDLLDALTAWGNLTCDRTRRGQPFTCVLGPSSSVLTLELEVGTIEIDLNWLVKNESISRRLCLASSGSLLTQLENTKNNPPLLVLGAMIMRHFIVQIDRFERTAAFAGVTTTRRGRAESCPSRAICKKEEIYFPQLNQCRDTGCQIILFMRYDPDTNKCSLNILVVVLMFLSFVSMAAIEWYLFSIHQELDKSLKAKKLQ